MKARQERLQLERTTRKIRIALAQGIKDGRYPNGSLHATREDAERFAEQIANTGASKIFEAETEHGAGYIRCYI